METKPQGTIYLITDGEFFKIGRTKKDVNKRLKELQTGNPMELYLVNSVDVINPAKVEACMHRRYSYCKQINEWFDLTMEDVQKFKDNYLLMDKNFELLKESSTLNLF